MGGSGRARGPTLLIVGLSSTDLVVDSRRGAEMGTPRKLCGRWRLLKDCLGWTTAVGSTGNTGAEGAGRVGVRAAAGGWLVGVELARAGSDLLALWIKLKACPNHLVK